jgi:hypothetical protein
MRSGNETEGRPPGEEGGEGTPSQRSGQRLEQEIRLEEGAGNLAGGAGVGSPAGEVHRAMPILQWEWREGKSSPYTGKRAARPAGKPEYLIATERFATIPSPSLLFCNCKEH